MPLRNPGLRVAFPFVTFGVIVLGLFSLHPSARAATIALNAVDSGWYDDTGSHSQGQDNYIVGWCGPCGRVEERNFFVFDLSGVTESIVAATLEIYNPTHFVDGGDGFQSPGVSRTYALHDVSTPVGELIAGGRGLTSIFDDLGSGTVYASRAVSSADNGTVVPINFNSAGLSVLNDNHGLFAVGGALSPLDTSAERDHFAGFSGRASFASNLTRELVLVTVPEPASIGLCAACLLLLLAWKNHRRRIPQSGLE